MDNLKSPAYPVIDWKQINDGTIVYQSEGGFTKLEKAALMIAQGICSETCDRGHVFIATTAVKIAKAVLEECNK